MRHRVGSVAASTPGTPAATPEAKVEIRLFQERDEPEVLAVLQAAFGAWPQGIESVDASEFLRWKHACGPFGRSTAVVAVVGGEIVGFLAWLPWLLRARTHTVRAMRVVDLAVHPEHRGRGVWGTLSREGRRYVPGDFAFTWSNPNELSYPGTFRTGQGRAGRLPRFARLGAPSYEMLLRVSRARASAARPPHVEAATAACVLAEDGAEQLLEAQGSGPADRLSTVIDVPYLRWRYGRFGEYRAVSADGGPASGIAIFRAHASRRGHLARVCELLVPGNDHRTMRDLLKRVRRAAAVDVISCAFPSSRDAARCGFLKVPGGAVITVRPITKALVPDPTRGASWALSLGDLELI
jgi:GNAT superfamily N-acetyltransferase